MLSRVKAADLVGILGYVLLVIVATVSWSLSARHLHAWGMKDLHESSGAAWLVPATFDLAPSGLSIVVYRARRRGRSALMWRLFIVAYTGVSSWINWTWTLGDTGGSRIVAASLPVAAVVLFEALMWQAHTDALDARYGNEPIPRVPLVAWIITPKRAYRTATARALRPLAAAEETLRAIQEANAATRKAPRRTSVSLSATPDQLAISAPRPAKKTGARDQVLDYKIENPDASQAEIASALRISAATVSRALSTARTAEVS